MFCLVLGLMFAASRISQTLVKSIDLLTYARRGGRVVECGGLENR